MVVKAISGADNNRVQTVHQKTVSDGTKGFMLGACAGVIEGYTRKSWLTKDAPSDTFVKNVSKDLETTLQPKEHKELEKVTAFFKQLTNYRTDVYEMRGRIEDSTELTNALNKHEGESTKDALDRIFSNPDKLQVKQELRDLQNRTQVDKKVDIYTARTIANANFDTKTKSLKQATGTSDEVFGILKSAARRIKVKTAVQHGVIGGFLVGTAGLLLGAQVNSKKDR